MAEAEDAKQDLLNQLTGKPAEGKTEAPKSILDAATVFIQHKTTEGVNPHLIQTYGRELGRLRLYCESKGSYTIGGITPEIITGYCSTWAATYASSYTRLRVRERLSGFFGYCVECRWIDRKPKLPKITVDSPPTMPLTADEYERVLAAVPATVADPTEAVRARNLIQLMRYSGLAIRDAVTLPRAEMFKDAKGNYRVVTDRQKTGTDVSVVLPPDVAEEILATPNSNPEYLFWSGTGNEETFAGSWGTKYVMAVMTKAGIPDICHMKSHRLRDTFAVQLLIKGVPLEEVAKLLGDSIRIAERHYAKWVPERQDRLDALVTATF